MRILPLLILSALLAGCATPKPAPAPIAYTGTWPEQYRQAQAAYLAWNAQRPGWKVTESGLQYHVLKRASGPRPEPGAVVTIHYTGRFIDGRVFDSSVARGEPATFPLGQLIKGWQEGVPMMRVGETWEFLIPADLAYGERDRAPIWGGSALRFEIQLIAIPGDE